MRHHADERGALKAARRLAGAQPQARELPQQHRRALLRRLRKQRQAAAQQRLQQVLAHALGAQPLGHLQAVVKHAQLQAGAQARHGARSGSQVGAAHRGQRQHRIHQLRRRRRPLAAELRGAARLVTPPACAIFVRGGRGGGRAQALAPGGLPGRGRAPERRGRHLQQVGMGRRPGLSLARRGMVRGARKLDCAAVGQAVAEAGRGRARRRCRRKQARSMPRRPARTAHLQSDTGGARTLHTEQHTAWGCFGVADGEAQ